MRCLSRPVLYVTRLGRFSSTFILRPYQEACLDACFNALDAGIRRIGVSLPTGAGKTAVFVSLLSRLESRNEAKKDAVPKGFLVIVNSIELARQTAELAQKMRPDWDVDLEQGQRYHAQGDADLTVATYQTLLRPERLCKFTPERIDAVVVDEAHHAAAPSYRRILSHFDNEIISPDHSSTTPLPLPRTHPGIPIFGFSATFSRHDGLALGSVFQRIVYHRDFLEMIKEQWLCNVRFTTVRANIDLKQVTINSHSGDFNATSLAHVINTGTVNKLVVQAWMDKAHDRKSTLVFCVNLAHVRDLTNTFRAFGVDARYLHAGTPAMDRKELVSAFRRGEYPVLVNCAILTEGADIPNIDCVVVARPTRSRNVLAQMIGRGMRLSPETGKTDCRIIDFVDVMNRMEGVISTPTLFGLNPHEIVDNVSTEELEDRSDSPILGEIPTSVGKQDTTDTVPDPKSVTFVDYEDPFALVHRSSGTPPHITKISRHEWVGCGGDIYVLECLGKGHIRIEPVEREDGEGKIYRAHFAPTISLAFKIATKFVPFQHKKHVLDAETLSDAVRGSDTYATMKVLLLRSAKWRRDPATSSQKAWVAKRWGMNFDKLENGKADDLTFPERITKLTKGEAANIITRIKHGAMVSASPCFETGVGPTCSRRGTRRRSRQRRS
ncbi:P-loop containing nucleoside triphosphate hydrolase protein [Vararia minispora EC-137]|uniref:P-loop containing nucleoside triphosphate hydrolase protein n=1 Tax=Vararia minispora EC-137 TaxID=1314806 RepID=A0ACB8QMV4_9AGAM|nr:P-loop containing nucleoside triphosphate hydrolase protein [Vararia minispora EC-137]